MQYKISELFAISELQLDAFWHFIVGEGPLKNYAEDLQKRVITSELPKPTINNVEQAFHGYTFTIPGTIKYDADISITFVEPVDLKVAKSVDEWLGKYYKKDATSEVEGKRAEGHSKMFQDFQLKTLTNEEKDTAVFHCNKALITDWDWGMTLNDGSSPAACNPVIGFHVNYFNWEHKNASIS